MLTDSVNMEHMRNAIVTEARYFRRMLECLREAIINLLKLDLKKKPCNVGWHQVIYCQTFTY